MAAALLWSGPVRADKAFLAWTEQLWPEAQAKGVTRPVFDEAFRGIEPDLSLPDLVLPGREKDVKGQAEFTRTPQEYLNKIALARLTGKGKALAVEHAAVLGDIARRLGVEAHIILAVWGRETAYGSYKLPNNIIRVLATQAYLGRRKEMFRTELIYALKMLQDGFLTRETMHSSWAGAMGLAQFMPSEYYMYAYDTDNDGRKDIWGSVADALGSAANQLKHKGWVTGRTWGYEVTLGPSVDCSAESQTQARPIAEWIGLGVARTQGRSFRPEQHDYAAYLLMPAGAYGPAFLVLENFLVLKRYNPSDLYALFVGHLADRIAGEGDFQTPWAPVTQLPAADIEDIQRRLQEQGRPMGKIDGKAGNVTRAQTGVYQKAKGLDVNCWPSQRILQHLRAAAVKQ
ncbi:MAG: lytic murein transglycosylase [Hyphomicrobiaceae bacterium]